MESLKPGDPICPVTGMVVTAVLEVSGIVMRLQFITKSDQPLDQANVSPNFIVKSAQARQLAQTLLTAADLIDSTPAA